MGLFFSVIPSVPICCGDTIRTEETLPDEEDSQQVTKQRREERPGGLSLRSTQGPLACLRGYNEGEVLLTFPSRHGHVCFKS